MVDISTELAFDGAAALLTNDGYFDRVRELCKTMPVEQAWQQVESELPFGLRRFTTIFSFYTARRKEAAGKLSTPSFKAKQ